MIAPPFRSAWIAFGANVGDRAEAFAEALRQLEQAAVRVEQVSRLYETTPVVDSPGGRGLDPASSPPFLNAAVRVSTDLSPLQLLQLLLRVEDSLGRDRGAAVSDRTCDLDLLAVDDVRMETPELTLPHPRLTSRAFVLVPLCELDPLARFPSSDPEAPTVGALLARLDVPAGAVRLWNGASASAAASASAPASLECAT